MSEPRQFEPAFMALLDSLREECITSADRLRLYARIAATRRREVFYCEYMFLASTLHWSHSAPSLAALADAHQLPLRNCPRSYKSNGQGSTVAGVESPVRRRPAECVQRRGSSIGDDRASIHSVGAHVPSLPTDLPLPTRS